VRLRPFFSYYGSKWAMARLYPAPRHRSIIEPFAGSAGYALAYYDRDVRLYDADPVVAGVWSYLIGVSSAEVLRIPDLRADETTDDLPVCQEAKWLVGFWLNRCIASPAKKPCKWMRDGLAPSSFWGQGVRQRIAGQVEAIRHWKVVHADFTAASGRGTWFVDPPYQVAGKHYRHGASGLDFSALGSWCSGLDGQVIVCENDGATWLPFRRLADTRSRLLDRRSSEVVWVNECQPSLFGGAE
jgi:hypothetical protein